MSIIHVCITDGLNDKPIIKEYNTGLYNVY